MGMVDPLVEDIDDAPVDRAGRHGRERLGQHDGRRAIHRIMAHQIIGRHQLADGYDMVQPSGEGAARCMRQALSTVVDGKIDYINAHGTSTPIGDVKELQAVRAVFGADVPAINSTKSLTGHSLGAAGAQESIYSLLMMKHRFLAASAHIDELDPEAADFPIIMERRDDVTLNYVMSNSFGFGGTNATLVFKRYDA